MPLSQRFPNRRPRADLDSTNLVQFNCTAPMARLTRPATVPQAGGFWPNRELVADESAATAGQNRRTTGETCPILLASIGGRTPEPAAVRDDVEPDRAATATDGIESWWPSQQRNLSTAGWGKEGCCKVSWNLGPFRAVLVLIETVGALQMKIISTTSRAGETDVQCWPFRGQKGNPCSE
jgi:hypothetical protein